MNTTSPSLSKQMKPRVRPAIIWTLSDAFILAKRQITQIPRVPDELVTACFQPAIIVLLFSCLFGGAIAIPGTSYVNYLMAGVMVQSVLFASANTGVGVATDLQKGLIDRFRSLPMTQSAVLMGRIFADQIRTFLIILVAWCVGLLVGFRPAGNIWECIAAIAILSLISFVFSWLSALVGLLFDSVEAVQQAAIIWLLPFLFGSSAFVPLATVPDWLRIFAQHQPVSIIMDAVRGLLLDHPDMTVITQSLIWCAALLVLLIPLAIWAYGRRMAK
jgi:ABC transporter DrrB family efflux protein